MPNIASREWNEDLAEVAGDQPMPWQPQLWSDTPHALGRTLSGTVCLRKFDLKTGIRRSQMISVASG